MQSKKTLFQLTLVLAIILSIVGIRSWLTTQNFGQSNDYFKVVSKINQADISTIRFTQGDKKLELTKENDVWKLASKSAEKSLVNKVLSGLIVKSAPLLVSKTEQQKEKLGLKDADVIKITLLKGDKDVLTVSLGKLSGAFLPVNINDDLNVYNLKEFPQISMDDQTWYDKTIVEIESENIKKLSFLNKDNFILEKNEGNWTVSGESESKVDTVKISNLTMSLTPLKASELVFESKQKEFNSKSSFAVEIETNDGKKETLTFYQKPKDDTAYLVKRESDGTLFLVNSYTAKSLNPVKKDFLVK